MPQMKCVKTMLTFCFSQSIPTSPLVIIQAKGLKLFFFFSPSGFSLGAWLTGRSPVSDLVKYAVNQMNLIKNNLVSFNSREMSLMSPLCIIVCKKCSHSTAYFSYTFQYVIILV